MSTLADGLSAAQVHARLKQALAEMRRAEENAVLCFAEILRRTLYRELGYSSIQAYASEELGFSESKTYQFLRLAGSLEKLPALRESLATGEIPWTKARALASVATSDNEKRWIEEARTSSRRELERKIGESRAKARSARSEDFAQGFLLADADAVIPESVGSSAVPAAQVMPAQGKEEEISVTLRMTPLQKARMEAMMEKIRKRASGAMRQASREDLILEALALCLESVASDTPGPKSAEAGSHAPEERGGCTRVQSPSPYQIIIRECPHCGSSFLQTGPGEERLSPASADRVACDARVLAPGRKNRSIIPPAVRRTVLARDGHRCRAKGCGRRRFLELHHLKPRSQGGSNEPDNIVTLCSGCHELLHERGLRGIDAAAIMDGAVLRGSDAAAG